MNKVILIGRTGQDPEVREVGQSKVCKFSFATSESFMKDGEKGTVTTWHNLVFWGKQCDTIKQYVKKGSWLAVEGKIQVRSYDDKNGVNHTAVEIVCDRFEFVGDAPKKQDKGDDVEDKIRSGFYEDKHKEMPF